MPVIKKGYAQIIPGKLKSATKLETKTTHLLLVEGVSDLKLIKALIENMPNQPRCVIQLIATEGKISEKAKSFKKLFDVPDNSPLQKVGLIADMDEKLHEEQITHYKQFSLKCFGRWKGTDHIPQFYKSHCDSMDPLSFFLTPCRYDESGHQVLLRNGTSEHYFLDHYLDLLETVDCCEVFHQAIFSEALWFNRQTDICSLSNAQAKWLTAILLLSMATPDTLRDNRTDVGLAVESQMLTPWEWPNLQALQDYLTAFLS